jgi:hypothetical protein
LRGSRARLGEQTAAHLCEVRRRPDKTQSQVRSWHGANVVTDAKRSPVVLVELSFFQIGLLASGWPRADILSSSEGFPV